MIISDQSRAAAWDWLGRDDRQPVFAVDTHTAGNPTRIVLSGVNFPHDVQTVDVARAWLRDHADHWRRRLVHEPRGGGLTCAVIPVPGRENGCDIGAVILEPGSYPPMCGHCMIGFATVVVELNLLPDLRVNDTGDTSFRVRTPAGPIALTAHLTDGRVSAVTLENVESYKVSSGKVTVDGCEFIVELLYGGDYYITVDASTVGLSLVADNANGIRQFAQALKTAFLKKEATDPHTGMSLDVYQVMLYERLQSSSLNVRIVVVAPPGAIDRSPCGTGSSALAAKLVTEGAMSLTSTLTTTSIIGSEFNVRVSTTRQENGRDYITPLVTGTAHINGFLTVAADRHDELANGFAPL